MAKPILVTGATGNVGFEVTKALEARQIPFRAGVRSEAGAREMLGDVPMVALDFDRPETFLPAVEGARAVFLVRPPAVANVKATLNRFIDCAIGAGVDHIVFLSVDGAERQSWVPHHAVEQHLFRGRAPWTILRPGFFAQNLGDAYRDDIRLRHEIVVPAGNGRVAFVDVRDVGEVAALAFEDPTARGQAWTLLGPEAVTFEDVARELTDALGREVRYVRANPIGYMRHLRRAHLPWMQVAVQTYLHVGLRFGAADKADPTLGRLLGREPRTIRNYIRDHVELWR